MISSNVPNHLVVAARTGFLTATSTTSMPWQGITSVVNMGAKSIDLVDLGAAPMPVQSKGKTQLQDFIEKTQTIKPIDWEITTGISYNAVNDDQTGSLERKCRQAGINFQKHINNKVFLAVENGDVAGNVCYDGLTFFNDAHVDAGAAYTTTQDNLYALALSLDNFTTVMVAAQKFRDDQGNFTEYGYNTLVVPPDLEYTAAQICNNREAYDTSSREVNAFAGRINYIVSPQLNTTAWALLAAGESIKPILLAMREQPSLQSAWFDPEAAEGGMYYFKFFARYNVYYSDWRLAVMGNS